MIDNLFAVWELATYLTVVTVFLPLSIIPFADWCFSLSDWAKNSAVKDRKTAILFGLEFLLLFAGFLFMGYAIKMIILLW